MTVPQNTLKERLCRLEDELDQLLRLQETKYQHQKHVITAPVLNYQRDIHVQKNTCMNMTTRHQTMFSNHRTALTCCFHDSAPLSDISKFLQHINLNISKGTQAIVKIANTPKKPEVNEDYKEYQENKVKNHENHFDMNNLKMSLGKKNNEDDLFKELREEKDKRMRAETQVKNLKEELKKMKTEHLQKTDISIQLLQEELKGTLEKLKLAENEITNHNQEMQTMRSLWPLKYETLYSELQEEKTMRREAEQKMLKLQETVQKLFVDTEDYLNLRQTVNWLKDQNEQLLCLTKKMRRESDTKDAEIYKKNQCIEDNLKKIKQLTHLCGKMRDSLVVMKEKATNNEEKLKINVSHCQKLADRMIHAQMEVDELRRSQTKDKDENMRLSDLVKATRVANDALQTRAREMLEAMKQQNELISRQSETISNKDEQLKLAYDNIKLQNQRLAELEKNISLLQASSNSPRQQLLDEKINQLELDLKHEKENVLIKEKLIDSHLITISDQKCALAKKEIEVSHIKREYSEIERRLAIEKNTKEELLSKIKILQSHKEELQQKIEELEEECDTLQSSNHIKRLEQLEKQVLEKQNEWETQKLQLLKEKDDALIALRSSTQKLAENKANYQLELDNNQKFIESLNSQIQEKNNKLQEANDQIKHLSSQLYETKNQVKNLKKNFEETMNNTFESWKKNMQQIEL